MTRASCVRKAVQPSLCRFFEATIAIAALAAPALGCSASSSAPPAPACTIAGQYLATGTVQSGTCSGTTTPVPDTFTLVGQGMANLMFGGMTGQGCTGPLTGCAWTCATVLMEIDALDPSKDELSLQYDYTFTSDGLSGTLTETADPAATLPSGCSGVILVDATRQ